MPNSYLDNILEAVEFQLLVARATGSTTIALNNISAELFMQMLQEKKKQETCDFCHEDKDGYTKTHGAFYLTLDVHQGWLLHAGKCKPRKIDHCPLCGRKLLTFKEEVMR